MGRNGKPSQGRKKVEMKKIESEDARYVCFSKRKKGVFAKACELSTLCGAAVALLLHSPTGTPFSFGSPSADKVFGQFMTGERVECPDPDPNVVNRLNQEYMELSARLDTAKAKREALQKRVEQAASKAKEFEWLEKIDQLGRDELLQLLGSLYRAKCSVNERIHALSGQGGTAPSNVDISNNTPSNAGTTSIGMAPSVAPPPANPSRTLKLLE